MIVVCLALFCGGRDQFWFPAGNENWKSLCVGVCAVLWDRQYRCSAASRYCLLLRVLVLFLLLSRSFFLSVFPTCAPPLPPPSSKCWCVLFRMCITKTNHKSIHNSGMIRGTAVAQLQRINQDCNQFNFLRHLSVSQTSINVDDRLFCSRLLLALKYSVRSSRLHQV